MTTDRPDDRASEQIKRASDVMYRHANGGLYDPMGLARALSDAGLLATPADQDDACRITPDGWCATHSTALGAVFHPMRADADDLRAKLERAEAEVERLRRWKAEAAPVLTGLQDLGKALGLPPGTRITGQTAAEQARSLKAEVDRLIRMLETVRAERDMRVTVAEALHYRDQRNELRATVVRVRELADAYEADATYEFLDPDGPGHTEVSHRATGYQQVADAIRAALDTAGGEQHE